MKQTFASSRRQRGVSLMGMIFVAVVVGGLGLLGVRGIPIGVEYAAVKKAAKAAAAGKSVAEVREMFDRSLQTDQVSEISSRDIQVTREGERVVVSFAYDRTLHLFGPAYLMFKLSGRSN